MSESNHAPATAAADVGLARVAAEHYNDIQHGRLSGRMSTMELVTTVLAFSAPIVIVSGYIPFVIGFDGAGAPMAFLVAMGMLLLFAVGFTTMTRYLPNPGAFYAYITAGLGPELGLGAALLACFSYICMGFAIFPFLGISADAIVSGMLGGPKIAWYWYSFAALIGIGALGYRRIDISAKFLSIAMLLEILIVLVFDAAVVAKGGPKGLSVVPFHWGSFTSGAVGISVLFSVLCFLGFEATAIFREEVREPNKTVPRATYLAVLLIGLFYCLAAWTTITAVGFDKAPGIANQNPTGMFGQAMTQYVGVAGEDIVHILLISSLMACLLSGQNILSRYFYNLGRDGVLPEIFGRAHIKHKSPYVAGITVGVLWGAMTGIFAVLGNDPGLLYGEVAAIGGFAVMVLMSLTSLAVVVYFRRMPHPGDTTVWHTTIAPLAAALGMAFMVYLAIRNFALLTGGSQALSNILQIVIWGVFGAGIVLALIYRRLRPSIYASIGRRNF